MALVTLDPGCTPGAAGPGTVTVCLKEDHEQTTAAAFSDPKDYSCDNITNRDTTLDYFVFVLPAAGDPGRNFVAPAPTVDFSNGGVPSQTSGTIGTNPKFFFASAAAGTTLEEASANSDNGTGTPTGGEAQVFNLTHTCPAGTTSSSSSSSSSNTSSSSSSSSSSTTTSSKSTSSSSSNISGNSSSSSSTTSSSSSSPSTSSTTSSTTSSPSSSSTTSSTTTTGTGGVSGTTTTTTTTNGGGGVEGITTPNTGGDVEFGAGLALLVIGGGVAFGGATLRRKKRS